MAPICPECKSKATEYNVDLQCYYCIDCGNEFEEEEKTNDNE